MASPLGIELSPPTKKLTNMASALQALCQGLAQLSQGLRATCVKLDHLESTVRQLKDPRRGFNG
jgi:hypothetical protein